MEALIVGYSSGALPTQLKHTKIMPFQGITKLVSNKAVIAHATKHNQIIPRLQKRSIFGFHNIFSKQQTAATFDGNITDMSIHECLVKMYSQETGCPLYQLIQSRGTSGFLFIYFDSYESEAMEVIDNLKPHIQDVFQPDFVNKFLQKISTTSYPFLQY